MPCNFRGPPLDLHHWLVHLSSCEACERARKGIAEWSRALFRELLKYKSKEGVRVVVLVWDDKTSHDKFLLKTDGMMQTHDEETKKFFRHSSIHCACSSLCKHQTQHFQATGGGDPIHAPPKVRGSQHSSLGKQLQNNDFIGRLDLCDGRYDTPEHRLYSDLDTVFKNDIHNPTFTSIVNVPRQPWHDLHCKVEGQAAYDIEEFRIEMEKGGEVGRVQAKKCQALA